MSDEGEIFGDIERPNGEVVRVALSEFKEKFYLNIRTHYFADDGDLRPTKKGVSIPVDSFDEFKEAIDKAAVAIAELPEPGLAEEEVDAEG